jgi:uncharacterized protein (TIGR02452 family)
MMMSNIFSSHGCGAFGNDSQRTAVDFRNALENEFRGAFSNVAFAITDWSPERQIPRPLPRCFFLKGE